MGTSEPPTATRPGQLSVPEINLLLLLDNVGAQYFGYNGSVRWGLTPKDVCDLLELAVDLFAGWQPTKPVDAWNRAASLLGVPAPANAEPGA